MYTNIPSEKQASSSDQTQKVFDQLSTASPQLDNNLLVAMKGFLETRNFSEEAAETISIAILNQAKKDNLNAMAILETIKGLKQAELSSLVAEVLNYNRFKSSSLGIILKPLSVDLVTRNVVV